MRALGDHPEQWRNSRSLSVLKREVNAQVTALSGDRDGVSETYSKVLTEAWVKLCTGRISIRGDDAGVCELWKAVVALHNRSRARPCTHWAPSGTLIGWYGDFDLQAVVD